MTGDLLPGPRILLGPGPTMADPRVLRAMATPLLGQADPKFTAIMGEVMALSRLVFQTENEFAYPVSRTGRAGLEAATASLVWWAPAGDGVDAAVAHYAGAAETAAASVSHSLGAGGIGRI